MKVVRNLCSWFSHESEGRSSSLRSVRGMFVVVNPCVMECIMFSWTVVVRVMARGRE